RGQCSRRKIRGGTVLHIQTGVGGQIKDQTETAAERLPAAPEERRTGRADSPVVGHFHLQMVIAQAAEQRQPVTQLQVVLHKQCAAVDFVEALFLQALPHAGNIPEAARVKVPRVDRFKISTGARASMTARSATLTEAGVSRAVRSSREPVLMG